MAANISKMRKLFEEGRLVEAVIAPAQKPGSWVFIAQRTDGILENMTVAISSRLKVYKSLEAAVADATRVGFEEVKLKVA